MNKLIIPILAVVLVAACTSGGNEQTTTATGKGLEITSFTADQTEVQSTKTLRVTMDVENSGGYKIPIAKSLAFLIYPSDWTFTDSSMKAWQKFGKDLDQADSARDIPADTDELTWRLTAPSITTGQTRPDTFEGRVYYDYTTRVTGTVWLYSDAEYEAARTGSASLSQATFESTEGPVKVEVSVSPNPPVITSTDRLFTLKMKITNAGGGTVYKTSALNYGSGDVNLETADLNILSISATPSSAFSSDCLGQQELIRGKDLTLTCDVTAPVPTTKQSFPIQITVSYGYWKAQTLNVNVLGK
jgi:hypothetical protein